jgi:hypothetical protein
MPHPKNKHLSSQEKAGIYFQTAGYKTIVLEYADLQILD